MAVLQDSEAKFFETYVQKNLALNDLKQAFYDQMVDTSNLESAATYAEQAAASAANAAAVVTGGTATLTPEAGKIPLADGTGKIANGWLPASPTFSGTVTTGPLLPTADNSKDLGSASYAYKDGRFKGTVYAGTLDVANTSGTTAAHVSGGSGATQAQMYIGYAGTSVNYFDAGTHYWRDAYAANRMVLSSTGLAVTGAITSSTYTKCGSYTVATVPSASASGAGASIYVTDSSGGSNAYFSDGTTWRNAARTALA